MPAPTNAALTTAIINPLLSSTLDTFDSMLGSKAKRGELTFRTNQTPTHEVNALISMTGAAKGMVCLGFTRGAALAIVHRLLDEQPDEINADVLDAVGEIANMVVGRAKSELNMGLNIGLPKVVRGAHLEVNFPAESTPMRLNFSSEIGPFYVDFGFAMTA